MLHQVSSILLLSLECCPGVWGNLNETSMHTRRRILHHHIFCHRSWGSWMVKNWQWLVRFYHLSWRTKGLMSCNCQHSFVVPIKSHLIDRLKSHPWRVVEVSKSEGVRVHGYVWWVDDLSVVFHYHDRYTANHPLPTTIVMCSWNQRGIWQRGRDPTHPVNKLRRLALVKSNYEVRFLVTRASAAAPRPEAADQAISENKDTQYEVRQFTCYVATLPDLDVLVVGLGGGGERYLSRYKLESHTLLGVA